MTNKEYNKLYWAAFKEGRPEEYIAYCERKRAYVKEYREKNREACLARERARRERVKTKRHAAKLERYRRDLERYLELKSSRTPINKMPEEDQKLYHRMYNRIMLYMKKIPKEEFDINNPWGYNI